MRQQRKHWRRRGTWRLGGAFALSAMALLVSAGAATAQTCTTQSAMSAGDRDGLSSAALQVAQLVQADDQAAVKANTIGEYARDFAGVADAIASTAPRLKGGRLQVEQIYILDASAGKDASAAKSAADAQFYCTLSGSSLEADFTIPQLPPGRYGFAMVRTDGPSAPWRLSLLLRQDAGKWLLAGLYPKPLTAAGNDGLWYWTEARAVLARKQPWVAWLYLQEAQMLLLPAGFVSSTHLDKLAAELGASAPPEVKGGVSAEAPLVVKGQDGIEYGFTGISVDDSLGREKIDVVAHLKVAQLGDAAAARKRNVDAMTALLAAHPELRANFHGVLVVAEPAGANPFATEEAMAGIR